MTPLPMLTSAEAHMPAPRRHCCAQLAFANAAAADARNELQVLRREGAALTEAAPALQQQKEIAFLCEELQRANEDLDQRDLLQQREIQERCVPRRSAHMPRSARVNLAFTPHLQRVLRNDACMR